MVLIITWTDGRVRKVLIAERQELISVNWKMKQLYTLFYIVNQTYFVSDGIFVQISLVTILRGELYLFSSTALIRKFFFCLTWFSRLLIGRMRTFQYVGIQPKRKLDLKNIWIEQNRTQFVCSPCIYFAIITFLMSMHRSFWVL